MRGIKSHLEGEAKSLVSDTWVRDKSLRLKEKEQPSILHELQGGDVALPVLTKKVPSGRRGSYWV